MKKKGFKKLNPDDTTWDKYYVINYLEPGKSWKEYADEIKEQEQLEQKLKREAKKLRAKKEELENNPRSASAKENTTEFNPDAPCFVPKNSAVDSGKAETEDDEVDTDNEETWGELPDYSGQVFISLFCDTTFQTAEQCLDFMAEKYNFDLNELSQRANFNFYDRIKIINYIRRVVAEGGKKTNEILTSIGKRDWDSIQYLFPTFENDQLLYSFESNDCEVDAESEEEKDDDKKEGEDGSGDKSEKKNSKKVVLSSGVDVEKCIKSKNYKKNDKIVVLAEDQPDAALIRSTSILKNLVLDD